MLSDAASRLTVMVLCVAGVLALTAADASAQRARGLWQEVEGGEGHRRVQELRQASGGALLSNFDPGSRVAVPFVVGRAMTNARLYLRYNNAMRREGRVVVRVTPEGGTAREVGELVQQRSERWTEFRWASLSLGALDRGRHTVELRCPAGGASGGLDVLVLLEDRWGGLYEPPTTFKNGRPVGAGRTLPPIAADLEPLARDGAFDIGSPVVFRIEATALHTDDQEHQIRWSIRSQNGRPAGSGVIPLKVAGGQTVTRDLTLNDGLPMGWYEARFDIAGRALGRSYFVSLPTRTRPEADGPIDGQWLGMNLGYGQAEDVVPDFRELGLGVIRSGGNKRNPTEHAPLIRDLTAAGLQVHWVINYRGSGVNPRGTNVNQLATLDLNGPVMRQWFENYRARCEAFFRAYSRPGREVLRYYIVGNEPDKKDPHTGLAGRPDIATRLTLAMALAANAVNPDGIVIQSPPVAQPDAGYLRRLIIDHRIDRHCDTIGTHVYGNQTMEHRIGKPWEWMEEAGVRRPLSNTEAGVTTGWTPKGTEGPRPGRQWQTDFMAHWYVKTKRMGYSRGILFTHDDDHTPDWAQLRSKGERLEPNWSFVDRVLTEPRPFRNGGFEQPNDRRSLWVPDRNLDIVGWMDNVIDFQATDEVHEGRYAAKLAQGLSRENLRAFQVVDTGITPGVPVTVRGWIKTTGTPARLSVNGYDPLDGDAQEIREVTSTRWTQVEMTVTPINPWIVIGLHAPRSQTPTDAAWFDAIEIETSE